MTRIVRRPITVDRWNNHIPAAFWNHQEFHRVVDCIDSWIEMGAWWDGEQPRRVVRVYTDLHQVFDLEGIGENWFIYRVWD